jgi:DNA invertase Pin-like site-specific DNA recombinase
VYLRISKDRSGEQLGVSRQRQDCTELCEAKGWTPVEYLDNDTSATNGKPRRAYEQMLADIRDGQIGAVVVWDLDRLHRRPIELEYFMALADEKHLALATVSGDVDLGTAQGRLVARLKGSVAAHEGEHRKARQLRATRQLAERGVPNWRRAFGYDANRRPDPKTAPLVAKAYADILAGVSLSEICRGWNAKGITTVNGKPWTASLLTKFLRKPRNAGLRTYKDNLYGPTNKDAVVGKGNWPPLVKEATFWAAQRVLNGHASIPKAVRRHLLTGLARCGKRGCGATLAASYRKDQIIYVCKVCHGVSILADNLEPEVYGYIEDRLAQPDAVDLLKAKVHDEAEAEAIRAEMTALYGQIEEANDEYDDGIIDGRRLEARIKRVNEKLAVLERRQEDEERRRIFDGLPLGTPAVAAALAQLPPDRIRAILDVLATVTVKPVGKIGRGPMPKRVYIKPKR